jgi:YVTN family beta-propeller protein
MRAWLSLLVGLGIAAFPSSFALAGPIAYINGGAVLSVIDTSTNAVVANVGVGRGPQGVAANPTGTRVYVANDLSSDVSIIDTASHAKAVFGWTSRPPEQSIVDTARSLLDLGIVRV